MSDRPKYRNVHQKDMNFRQINSNNRPKQMTGRIKYSNRHQTKITLNVD